MDYSLKDRTLLFTALGVAIIGLLSLFIIMIIHTPEEQHISGINESLIGKKTVVTGIISSIRHSKDNKTTFLKISEECMLDVTVFQNIDLEYDSIINNTVRITGKVQEYNGQIGMIADNIQIINNKYEPIDNKYEYINNKYEDVKSEDDIK